MYKVLDTITLKNSWTYRYPDLAERGEGLLVILDPAEIGEPPEIQGRSVTLHKPDGNVAQFVVAVTEAHHSVVGLFFKDVASEDIPRGSLIEW